MEWISEKREKMDKIVQEQRKNFTYLYNAQFYLKKKKTFIYYNKIRVNQD
jgi:hypothetical protein